MKIQFYPKDAQVIHAFLQTWLPDESELSRNQRSEGLQELSVKGKFLAALTFCEEAEPLYLDCSPEELANAFQALTEKGFVQSAKSIYIGDHFYRSDTGKCPRCWRYRPEIHWNNENIPEAKAECCDRCNTVMLSTETKGE